jgi:hypothetical protein
MIAFLEALYAAKHPKKAEKVEEAEDTQVHGLQMIWLMMA